MMTQIKEYVTKTCERNVRQKGFHDEVIRAEQQYLDAWNYVAYNAAKWESDDYYVIQ